MRKTGTQLYLSRGCCDKNVNWCYHHGESMECCPTFVVSADGTCLLSSGVVHVTCSGFQKEVIFYCIFIENVKRWTFPKLSMALLSVSGTI